MENVQSYQRPLELFATRRWLPLSESAPGLRIVSGGQTGVDRAAHDAALAIGLSASDVRKRTSVQDSDATLILTLGAPDAGTQATAEVARRMAKPFLVVSLDSADAFEKARAWMEEVKPQVLNVAGPRGSRQPGMYGRTYAFVSRLLRAGNYLPRSH